MSEPIDAQANRVFGLAPRILQAGPTQCGSLLQGLTDLAPQELAALEALASILKDEGKVSEAVLVYLHVARLCPDNSDVLYNAGVLLRSSGRLEDAAAALRQALARRDDDFDAHKLLGNVLQALGQTPEAIACLRRAVVLKPDFADAFIDLGNALLAIGEETEALDCYLHAVRLRPGSSLAQYNLGFALMERGSVAQAIECYRRALAADPDLVEAQWNCALALLLTAEFEQGWELFEARLRRPPHSHRRLSVPRWSGEDLAGKTILVHAEQGFGDTVQFVRYIPLLIDRFQPQAVILECQPELKRLMQCIPGVAQVVAGGIEPPPRHDLHIPLLSLPLLFKTTLESIPARAPYLAVPAALARQRSARLASEKRMKVGLAWAGRPTHPRDARRSIAPELLAPLIDVANVCFVSLQKNAAAPPAIQTRLLDHTGDMEDFADTAGLIAELDLVISVDTAVAHLAGAMGKPVWLLLSHAGEWRWLRERPDSPWYPGMTIFRQEKPGGWSEVLQRVAAALRIAAA